LNLKHLASDSDKILKEEEEEEEEERERVNK
jgi:hypothetical protein